jgi:hypothetical protein
MQHTALHGHAYMHPAQFGPRVHVHHPSFAPPGLYGPPGLGFFPAPPGPHFQRTRRSVHFKP